MWIHNSWWIFLCFHARDTTLDCLFDVRINVGPVYNAAGYVFHPIDARMSWVQLFQNSTPEFCRDHNPVCKHKTLINDVQRIPSLLKLLQLSRWPWTSEKLDNFLKHSVWSRFLLNFNSRHRNSSDTIGKCALEIILNAEGRYDGVIIWDRMWSDEAWQYISLTKFCCSAVFYLKITP